MRDTGNEVEANSDHVLQKKSRNCMISPYRLYTGRPCSALDNRIQFSHSEDTIQIYSFSLSSDLHYPGGELG